MPTETKIQLSLLKRRERWSPYLYAIVAMYVIYVAIMYRIGNDTVASFKSLPEENQTIPIPQWMIDDAKLYNETVQPIVPTKDNILTFWGAGNVPVALHLIYVLLAHWSPVIQSRLKYVKTNNKTVAAAALLRVTHTTDLVSEVSHAYMCPIYHYYFEGKYYQKLEFENDAYLIGENNEMVKQFSTADQLIPAVYDITKGLTAAQVHQQQQKFGSNQITLKFPVYLRILRDEILSPYFAFEVFCSVLYALDSFAMYSLFSIVMLIFVQGANVHQKYNSLKQTCQLAPKPVKVAVVRAGALAYIASSTLVPGDLVVYKREDQLIQAQQQQERQDLELKEAEQKNSGPMAMLMNNAMFKLVFKMKESFFGQYQDENIYKNYENVEFSDIFPADMILVKGQLIADESILTGEQTSQIKEAISEALTENNIQSEHKIFAGTKLIQLQTNECMFLVSHTSSGTEQGKLIKTIAFNEERMNITTKDSLVFLFIMFIVACISSVYTLYRGYTNKICKLNTLVLESLMVFVAVIPPDLPTELSMCINNAISEMRKKKVYSTEPYRILNAGRCRYICFDKSGTLTQTNIKILGVDSQCNTQSFEAIIAATKKGQQQLGKTLNNLQKMVLATCQSITMVDKKTFGDILEINAFKAIEGELDGMNIAKVENTSYEILRRYYFNSVVKRMSVICKQGGSQFVCTKGSPEALRPLLQQVPSNYDKVVQEYTKRGLRILTLAYKQITGNSSEISREQAEKQLSFVGFLVCQTPLKKDTKDAIQLLQKSEHLLRVISGDHVLNVAVCAQQCGIIHKDEKILLIEGIKNDVVTYVDVQNVDEVLNMNVEQFLKQDNAAFCLTNSNDSLQYVLDNQKIVLYQQLLEKSKVFARTTPQQKASILKSYQQLPEQNSEKSTQKGLNARTARCMFVGDGANDICVIQAADLGVALLEEQPETEQKKEVIPYPSIMVQPGNKPAGIMMIVQEAQARSQRRGTDMRQEQMILMREQQIYKQYLAIQKQKDKLQNNNMLAMWSEALEQEDETGGLQLGDAAMAAQFTVKSGSLAGVLDIVRQGRCALATVQMNFKTTALSCLVGAYSMTAMTLNGVRKSDYQLIASSLLSTQVMMNISKAKQEQKLSAKRPPHTIVGRYLVSSMFLQSLVHIVCLYLVQRLGGYQHQTVGFGHKFEPSRVNTCVFFMQMFLDTCVTLVNYPGEPHMQSILKHKKLLRALAIYFAGMLALLFQVIPELNEMLGFVELDDHTRFMLIAIGAADFGLTWVIEKGSSFIFG